MGFATYAELGRNPVVRRILLVSFFIRVPMWAAGVVLTLHVVGHLDRSYAQAGLVDAVYALALAISGPWRGRLLDRIGLRATLTPSLLVTAACWAVAPWVGYWALVALVAVVGLFMVPSFSIVRQVLIGAVGDRQRTAVLSLDSVATEFTFMLGPVLGVLAATYLPTTWALVICQSGVVVGGMVLWLDNPSLGVDEPEPEAGGAERHRVRDWLTPTVLVVLATSFTATIVLTGEDLGTVAALREMGHTSSIGWVLALWGLGSAVGGIVYGALRVRPPSAVLLALLAGSATMVALADSRLEFTVMLLLSGLFCAPTITATVDDLTRAVPARVRGEAMGWHGSALTVGGAMGAPVVGGAIDHGGWPLGFAVTGLSGLLIAVVGLGWRFGRRRAAAGGGAVRRRRRRRLRVRHRWRRPC